MLIYMFQPAGVSDLESLLVVGVALYVFDGMVLSKQ